MTVGEFFAACRARKRAITENPLDALDDDDAQAIVALEKRWKGKRK